MGILDENGEEEMDFSELMEFKGPGGRLSYFDTQQKIVQLVTAANSNDFLAIGILATEIEKLDSQDCTKIIISLLSFYQHFTEAVPDGAKVISEVIQKVALDLADYEISRGISGD